MNTPTVSSLFSDAAKLLRTEFEVIRSSNPHSAEKGAEVEDILKSFLNTHLPQRFFACSGIMIDNENSISKQTDVIIYDTLASPVYRSSKKTQIVPVDTVASVIEVKTCLNKSEIEDSYNKIASCKQLKKRPLSPMDQMPTGSDLATVGTLGIIFGFDSDTSIETLADNLKELNNAYESNLWPDMVVLLDKGVINYGVAYPGANNISGELAPPCDINFPIPPFYIHLMIHKDAEFSLNRFFCSLLSHLTFYPHRLSTPPFEIMLQGTAEEAMITAAYQFNTKRQLKSVPPEMYSQNKPKPNISMRINNKNGPQIGLMQFIPWQDGSVIRWFGSIPLQLLLTLFLPTIKGVIVKQPNSNAQLSSVLNITEKDFRTWPDILAQKSDMTGSLE